MGFKLRNNTFGYSTVPCAEQHPAGDCHFFLKKLQLSVANAGLLRIYL